METLVREQLSHDWIEIIDNFTARTSIDLSLNNSMKYKQVCNIC